MTLLGAEINGTLSMTGAALAGTDERGRSLLADRLAAGGVQLDNGFKQPRRVSLRLATITADLAMSGATLSGTDARDRSLVADGVKVGGGIYLTDRFTAKGAVDLAGARVERRIDLTGDQPLPRSGAAGRLYCSEFVDSESSWPPPGQLRLGGFRFTWLDDEVGWTRRLSWLRRQGSETWSADPYEQRRSTTRGPAMRPQPVRSTSPSTTMSCTTSRRARRRTRGRIGSGGTRSAGCWAMAIDGAERG